MDRAAVSEAANGSSNLPRSTSLLWSKRNASAAVAETRSSFHYNAWTLLRAGICALKDRSRRLAQLYLSGIGLSARSFNKLRHSSHLNENEIQYQKGVDRVQVC